MKKTAPSAPKRKVILLGVAAVTLLAVSFAFASGSLLINGRSLLASIGAVISGNPTVMIIRDGSSPAGNISAGDPDVLAAYDISARNVTHWATINYVPLQIAIQTAAYSPLALSNIRVNYSYCIPPGTTYGYGYISSGCANIQLAPFSITMSGSTYIVDLGSGIPIYPQESSGTLTVYATPTYQYTGTARHYQSGNGTLQVIITPVSASGDQCQWAWIPGSGSYGYTDCIALTATTDILAGQGNTLTVIRPYGYGYEYGYRNGYIQPISLDACSATPTLQCLQNEVQQLIAIIAKLLASR
jgi:hypothetical protein